MGRRVGRWVACLLVAATGLVLGIRWHLLRGRQTPVFQSPAASRRPSSPAVERLRAGAAGANVIIILMDAAAAGHFTSYGYALNTTPNLATFLDRSALLTEAYATGASTKPSVASLFTSQFPDTHGAVGVPSRLTRGSATLAECLKGAGYLTAAFSASASVSVSFGYGRGFSSFHEVFRDVGVEPTGLHPRHGPPQSVSGALVLASVSRWLKEHYNQRLFAYIHFLEPHRPNNAPESFRQRFLAQRRGLGPKVEYDASLAYVDSLVGKLLGEMRASGLLDRSVVVVLADHGEAFGEHGRTGHSSTVYREMVRVPLAFHLPRRCGAQPRRRSEVFCLTDLMPTLLDLLRIAPPKTMQGRSRLGLLAGEQEGEPSFAVSRAIGSDTTGGQKDPTQVSYALRVPRYTLLLAEMGRRVELYDRDQDPQEQHNLAKDRQDLVGKLQAQFAAWAATQRGRPVVLPGGRVFAAEGKVSDMDEQTRRQLKSLGYLE